jgi:hypothetical protein
VGSAGMAAAAATPFLCGAYIRQIRHNFCERKKQQQQNTFNNANVIHINQFCISIARVHVYASNDVYFSLTMLNIFPKACL